MKNIYIQYLFKALVLEEVSKKFHGEFPESVVPSKETIYRAVVKFCVTKSVSDKRKTQKDMHQLKKHLIIPDLNYKQAQKCHYII